MKANLTNHGFTIEDELGVCEMIHSWREKQFDYRDFVVGSALSRNVEGSYIQYYRCREAIR